MSPPTLPAYRCHKTVQAVKIDRVEGCTDGTAWIFAKELDEPFLTKFGWHMRYRPQRAPNSASLDKGYYVRYADGYESWSPSAVFEDGYTRIDDGESAE